MVDGLALRSYPVEHAKSSLPSVLPPHLPVVMTVSSLAALIAGPGFLSGLPVHKRLSSSQGPGHSPNDDALHSFVRKQYWQSVVTEPSVSRFWRQPSQSLFHCEQSCGGTAHDRSVWSRSTHSSFPQAGFGMAPLHSFVRKQYQQSVGDPVVSSFIKQPSQSPFHCEQSWGGTEQEALE